jgi:ribosomal protein S18 acetylase RimI-like enzyme
MILIADIDSELFFDAYLLCKIEYKVSYEWFSKQQIAVYLDDGTVKGFVGWQNTDQYNTYISLLVVGEKYRRLGVGFSLMLWLTQQHNEHIFTLNVSVKNDGAIQLYKKIGFEILRTIENYYHDEESDIYTGEGRNSYLMCIISHI